MSINEKPRLTGDCPTFEDALQNLERIVHDLEEGQIGLAESLARYEEGVRLLKQCYGLLEGAERKIELLSGFDAAGNPVTVPFDDESTISRDEKSQVKTRRRSASPEDPTRESLRTEKRVSQKVAKNPAATEAVSPAPGDAQIVDDRPLLF